MREGGNERKVVLDILEDHLSVVLDDTVTEHDTTHPHVGKVVLDLSTIRELDDVGSELATVFHKSTRQRKGSVTPF